jgi:hypothetical protein
VTAALLWTFGGPEGSADVCITDSCDCERVGEPPIRQPANAWSSLAIAAVGVAALTVAGDRRVRLVGTAVVATGTAAFLAHAHATAWARGLDGAGIILLLAVVTATEVEPRAPVVGALAAAPVLGLLVEASARPLTMLLAGLMVMTLFHNRQGRDRGWALVALGLFGVGGLVWWLASGAWCSPDSGFQWHAVWHLVAASGLGAGLRYLHRPPDPLSRNRL